MPFVQHHHLPPGIVGRERELLLLRESSEVATPWLGVLGAVELAAGALVWMAPLPGYLLAGAVWSVMVVLGSLVLTAIEAE